MRRLRQLKCLLVTGCSAYEVADCEAITVPELLVALLVTVALVVVVVTA